MQRLDTHGTITRRRFLTSTASMTTGGLLLPAVVPARALGRGATAPNDRINLGLIGCGNRGMYEARCVAQTDKAQFVALCDPWDTRTQTAKQTLEQIYAQRQNRAGYRGCTTHRDFRELLARPDVDAVYIATSDHWHVPMTIAAARAGKDMLTEKPLGVSIEQDLAARDAVRRYGRVFQYGAERRSTAAARHAIELVLNGRIGKVQSLYVVSPGSPQGGSATPVLPTPKELDYDLWLGPAPEAPFCHDRCLVNSGIFHIYDYAIGFIAGWAAHPLDMIQWWADHAGMGIPVEYQGSGTLPSSGLFNVVMQWDMLCRYAGGLTMRFMDNITSAKTDIPGIRAGNAATFVGSEGWISVGYSEIQAQPAAVLGSVIRPDEIRIACGDYAGAAYVEAHHASWHDCIRTRRDPVGNIETSVRSDLVSHLCDISIRLKRPIRWDPQRETIVADDAAGKMMSRAVRAPWHL